MRNGHLDQSTDASSKLSGMAFYAQIDKRRAIQDYEPRHQCVRLVGISSYDYACNAYLNEDGCLTYIIDISRPDFLKILSNSYTNQEYFSAEEFLEGSGGDVTEWWIYVSYEKASQTTDSYAYMAFIESGPIYLSVRSIRVLDKLVALPPLEVKKPAVFNAGHATGTLSTFHVGQGMCSVYTYAGQQFLLDAGAGKPVTREVYQRNYHLDGSSFKNDLHKVLKPDKRLVAIISHLDSDHWRMLEWDLSLCNHVSEIYFPIGTSFLAMRSAAIVKKVKGLASCTLRFDRRNTLAIYRATPVYSDSNGEGLVVVATCDGYDALLPGDYVYERMLTDLDIDLGILALQSYAAVVVPHHGDTASAKHVPLSSFAGMQFPIAFFSAGTHAKYRHPRHVSLLAHTAQGFTVVADPMCRDIIEKRLL